MYVMNMMYVCSDVYIYVILLTLYMCMYIYIDKAPSCGSHKYCERVGIYVCLYVHTYAIKNKNCEMCGTRLLPPSGCQTKQKEASGEMLDDGDIRPPLEPNVLITALNASRRRARDLPSQLLHQLCVVGREELDHEAEDGVLGPCGGREREGDGGRERLKQEVPMF